jgi:Lon protease-like protein
MKTELEELPLFPLNTVLFPYASIQLHVFEDRYREMVQACVRDGKNFGIVLIRNGAEVGDFADPYLVGTSVRVRDVHVFEDGRLDLYVQGESRFRIRQLDDSRAFLVGLVEPVKERDIRDDELAQALMLQAREEFEVLVQRLFERQEFDVQVVFPSDPVVLSFTIANLLSMENIQKQQLLETTDTLERVQSLLPILREHILEVNQPSYFRMSTQDLADFTSSN